LKRLGKLTLKREVFLLSLTHTLIFTLVFILIFGNVLFASKLNEMKQKLHNSNMQMKIYLDTLFDGCAELINFFELTLNLDSQDPQEQAKALETFDNIINSAPQRLSVFVGYADGSLLINDYVMGEDYDASARPWYREAVACYPQTLIALPYQEYTSGEWCFCTARALANDDGEITAVIAVDFPVEELFESAIAQSEYTTQINYMMNEDGICLYHPNRDYIGSNMLDNLAAASEMLLNTDEFVEYTFHDERRIACSQYLANTNSILVSSISRSDAIQPAYEVVRNVLLGLVVMSVLMSALFMTVFDYRYAMPVKSLKVRLAALLGGASIPEAEQPYPNHEFSEIAESMEKLTQHTMNRKAEELNAILESSSDGILVLDRNDHILHYNAQLLKLWGLPETGTYQTYGDLNLSHYTLMETENVHPSRQQSETEYCYLKSGVILERYTRVLTEREDINGLVCVYRDATQKVKKEEQLKEIANTDFLTGLSNRRYFTFQSAREFRKARETDAPLALLLLDIDDFKRINDTYGHDVGDRALKAFAMHLRQCSRRSDILGRYGGEEFCVLLPYTQLDVAKQIAERIRGHFETTAIDHKGSRISWTVSIGVAINSENVPSIETLIKHADIACYAAKQQGRNRVRTYPGEYTRDNPDTEN